MNNLLIELIGMSMLCGIFLLKSMEIVVDAISRLQRRHLYPSVVRAKYQDMCKGLHKWNDIMLVINGLEPKKYLVCLECGAVSGTKKRLNKAGLESFREKNKLLEDKKTKTKQLLKDRQVKLDEAMNRLIKTFFIANPDVPIQPNIEFLQQFFRKSVLEIDTINMYLSEKLDEFKR